MTPVNPPKLNKNINPMLNNKGVFRPNEPDHSVLNQLKILEQVGIAIIDGSLQHCIRAIQSQQCGTRL